MEIRTSMGYVSIARTTGREIEARLGGRRSTGPELHVVLRNVGIPAKEAEKVASMLRHPTVVSIDDRRPQIRVVTVNKKPDMQGNELPDRPDEYQPILRQSEN